MVQIPAETIAEVRHRADLEQVVGRHVRLTKKGRRMVGLCPFHNEKTPSFGVSTEKQLFHCFGCGVGGDVFKFLMLLEGLEFPEAVRMLAQEVGVKLPEREESPRQREIRQGRERLWQVNEVAAQFYEAELRQNREAQTYLAQERGLNAETAERFRIGWAPAGWEHLAHHLKHEGISTENGVKLGLLGQRASGNGVYDRLRGRIVFPIEIPGGAIAGFGARRADWIDPEGPKYLNSPESPIYDKSSILYGLAEARSPIRKAKRALIVEGYLDVIALAHHGIEGAVAGCGTALTPKHAQSLARLANEVVTLYDGDSAGQEATRKATELLLGAGLRVRVGSIPEGDDPDTYVRRYGRDSLQKLIDEAPSAIDFFVARARGAYHGGGIAGTTQALDVVKPMILAIRDPLERDVTLQATARALGINTAALSRHLSIRGPRPRPSVQKRRPQTRANAIPSLESTALRMVLESREDMLHALESREALDAFSHDGIHTAVQAAYARYQAGEPFDGADAMDIMRAHGVSENDLDHIRHEVQKDLPNPDPIDKVIDGLLDHDRKRRVQDLKQRLAQETDPEIANQLMAQATELMRAR